MLKNFFLSIVIFIILFSIDQYIKSIFIDGYILNGDCVSLVLVYNKGVAFSMFAFLKEYLKYIQILLLVGGVLYLILNKHIFEKYFLPISFLFAGGISNIYDRFIHQGVVDYVYWHCGFDFAIFNLADVIIDIAIVLIFFINYKPKK